MEIVCDCANARVAGEGHLGAKPLDGSDPVEQAEKITQVRPYADLCLPRLSVEYRIIHTKLFLDVTGRSKKHLFD